MGKREGAEYESPSSIISKLNNPTYPGYLLPSTWSNNSLRNTAGSTIVLLSCASEFNLYLKTGQIILYILLSRLYIDRNNEVRRQQGPNFLINKNNADI